MRVIYILRYKYRRAYWFLLKVMVAVQMALTDQWEIVNRWKIRSILQQVSISSTLLMSGDDLRLHLSVIASA